MSRPPINRIAVIQTLIILMIMVPLISAGFYVWSKHQLAQVQLNDLEPRYARLLGLMEHQADLKKLSAQVTDQLARLAYPPDQDVAKAGNEAQQRIRSLFIDSGLEVISIQVLPPKEEAGFDRIQISLRVEGDILGLHSALSKLATQSPLILIDNMALQTIGAVRPASQPRLGGQFSLTMYRLRS